MPSGIEMDVSEVHSWKVCSLILVIPLEIEMDVSESAIHLENVINLLYIGNGDGCEGASKKATYNLSDAIRNGNGL